ncbi:beta-barrel assembly complex subunit BamF [Pacificibacter maritimus]|uniref:Beta-barrel assembly complex subunit BamF n=1 Tax=Pacificibacter maritimus TaxID=762213 RepID=A0A3N4U225_9RHOB|nr:DUF3035 domain-containing protein [Pacificibacter maritimus]RPE64883.1 beta-barrel assembly complex subunit BamF [Pacificibacter maritimus]
MLHRTEMKMVICAALVMTVSACSPKANLTPNSDGVGPDEFAISVAKPLEAPNSFASLPTPTPGGSNRTDATPKADAVVALGGRVPTQSGADAGIVTYASRYGVDPAIRSDLAQADQRFLKRKSAAPRFPWTKNLYERAYRRLALDPWKELERLQAKGVSVPSAPSQR